MGCDHRTGRSDLCRGFRDSGMARPLRSPGQGSLKARAGGAGGEASVTAQSRV